MDAQKSKEKTFEVRQREAQKQRKRRKKKKSEQTMVASNFSDLYKLTGETLGEGSYGKVETCLNIFTELEFAVKIIEKRPGLYSRSKVLKEIEIYHMCRGHPNIIQLIEFFEEEDRFCLVFEKISGGPLLDHIQTRICFTEAEASSIVADLAGAIRYLHERGVAHRDLKPDNVLCVNSHSPCPVKLGDFDLCSQASMGISTPTMLTPVGSLEYMAPEVVQTFLIDDYDDEDDEEEISYNKKCDLWSLGVIMYILLCGYAPFSGNCGLDCGWERGESCMECQELLFSSIKEGKLIFPEQHWATISPQAKDLIEQLLVKDSALRLSSEQVLGHPWILGGGCRNPLDTPSNLRRQASIKDLEDFASRAMAVNRAVEENNAVSIKSPARSETWSFDSTPPLISTVFSNYEILQKRRRSRVNLWDKKNKFCSIDELELENDFFMKAIY
jgi:MAP kinase interacting serine/threonine kinase